MGVGVFELGSDVPQLQPKRAKFYGRLYGPLVQDSRHLGAFMPNKPP